MLMYYFFLKYGVLMPLRHIGKLQAIREERGND